MHSLCYALNQINLLTHTKANHFEMDSIEIIQIVETDFLTRLFKLNRLILLVVIHYAYNFHGLCSCLLLTAIDFGVVSKSV